MYNTLTIGNTFPSVQLDLNSLIKNLLVGMYPPSKYPAENARNEVLKQSWTRLTSLLYSCPEIDGIEQALKDLLIMFCNSCHVVSSCTVVTVYREDVVIEARIQKDFHNSLKDLKNIDSETTIRVYFSIEGETTHPVEVSCRFTVTPPIEPFLGKTRVDRDYD